MKVILTQDVESIGFAGQVMTVKRGFARNKLLPAKLAVEATPGNLKAFERARAEYKMRAMKEKERAKLLAAKIEDTPLTFHQKVGEKGKLYGSVTSMDLAEAMSAQGIEIDRRKFKMTEPIKAVGEYEVPVKVGSEVTAVIKVNVMPIVEEGAEENPEER